MSRKLPLLAALAAALTLGVPAAPAAAAAPAISSTWPTTVSSTSANLRAEINPGGLSTSYRFEYITEAAFLSGGFTGATKIPASGSGANIGLGEQPVAVVQHPGSLEPNTPYRFRVVATNSSGTTNGPARPLGTDENAPTFSLPDARGWEMVSPVDKNGGEIQGFGANFGGGVIQAAAQGGAVTYTSASSFADAQGAPGASQYVSSRETESWATHNVTPPALSGSYPEAPTSGVPYQLFSGDLGSALFSNGRRCRSSISTQCPVENPPMPGSGAPAGYRNYYLRDSSKGSFKAVLASTDLAGATLGPEDFEVAFAGATPDLAHVVLSTCAALTAGASEVAGSEGECDPTKPNLYEKSGSTLKPINTAPGAKLAAQSRAISADGSRVYFYEGANLYLSEGAQTKQVDDTAGGGGTFQTASSDDGSVAFFTTQALDGGHLWRYTAATDSATDLTPAGGVLGVLGASDDGAYVYYMGEITGIFLWHSGTVTPISPSVDPASIPPTTGAARVSADGHHLAFAASAQLTDYENRGVAEVYLFTAPGSPGAGIVCASCNPSGELAVAAASLPGASPNGDALAFYKPRVLSADSKRLFFNSFDALALQDTNNDRDVYQWEANGSGDCARALGCVRLISSGKAENGASFLDASADGSDVFFLTDGSLVPPDPGATDVYDARVGGGFPLPEKPIPCFGDNCQSLPSEPEDPTPGTLRVKSSGNLPPVTIKPPKICKKGQIKRGGKCFKKKTHRKKGGHR